MVAIQAYWFLVPIRVRNPCVFRVSCSKHVFDSTKNFGFNKGIIAFKDRWSKCKNGYYFKIENDELLMYFADGSSTHINNISEYVIKNYKQWYYNAKKARELANIQAQAVSFTDQRVIEKLEAL